MSSFWRCSFSGIYKLEKTNIWKVSGTPKNIDMIIVINVIESYNHKESFLLDSYFI